MKFMNRENSTDPTNSKNSTNFFFNRVGRARSGWRFLIFQLLFAFLYASAGIALLFLITRLTAADLNGKSVASFVVPNVVLLFAALGGGWLCAKFLENLPFRSLGLWFTKNWLKDLFFGAAIGVASISFAVLIGVLLGGMRLQANGNADGAAIFKTLGVSLIVFVIAAAAEEALFRGYILQTFTRARLAWFAILLTSVLFATAHNNNQSATFLSWLNTFLAGIWFGFAYLKTRSLWFPFGIHMTWNWLQGAFFGLPVSGITSLTTAPFFEQIDKGANLWTGGDYGIEGGIACTIAIIISGALVWFSPIFKLSEEMFKLTNEENARVKSTDSDTSKSPEF